MKERNDRKDREVSYLQLMPTAEGLSSSPRRYVLASTVISPAGFGPNDAPRICRVRTQHAAILLFHTQQATGIQSQNKLKSPALA
jgi:hypothetical protein